MKILVVEDSPDSLELLVGLLLKRRHSNVKAVSSGMLAIEAMAEDRFDFVICDYHMPEMSGHEVFEILKKTGVECSFLLWTNADHDSIPKFEGYGFLGIVKKQEFDQLFGKLEGNRCVG
jgi:CheY-like chemotaxis protein